MENPESMDAAAIVAAQELVTLNPEAVAVVAEWWNKHFHKAGHKRLARSLLATRPKPAKAEWD